MSRSVIEVNENTSLPITATLKDSAGTVIPSASIVSIEMTLVNVVNTTLATSIINSRQKQDVFNANDCTYHATSGLFTWNVQVEDTTILGSTPTGQRESHLATITVVWDTDKQMQQEIELAVLNLRNVPQVGA